MKSYQVFRNSKQIESDILFLTEMINYFGGYYLLRLRKFGYGRLEDKEIYTSSDCTVDALMESWSFSWIKKGKDELENIQNDFRIGVGRSEGILSSLTDLRLALILRFYALFSWMRR